LPSWIADSVQLDTDGTSSLPFPQCGAHETAQKQNRF